MSITVITLLSTELLSKRWDSVVSKILGEKQVFINNPNNYPVVNKDYETHVKIIQPDLGSFPANEANVITQLCAILRPLIEAVTTEYVLLLDDDIVPPDGFVEQLKSNLSDTTHFAVALAPQSNWPLDNPTAFSTVSYSLDFWNNFLLSQSPTTPFKVLAGGFNCCVAKAADLKLCLPLYCELDGVLVRGWDWTIGKTIKALGKEIVCDPRVLCSHMKT